MPVLRPGQAAAAAVTSALARAHVHGVRVDWAAILGAGQRIGLPTYAFQRQRYWPRPGMRVAGDVRSAGLGVVGHPLLAAAVELAGGDGLVLTGLVSARTQPWLADHVVAGAVVLPGTAFVELAVRAGDAAGCGRVEELTLETPLVLPADGGAQVQVTVGGPGPDGRRDIAVYARDADAGPDQPWTRHASGLLGPVGPPGAAGQPGAGGPGRAWRPSSRCGRRAARSRWRPAACTRRWRRADTGTGRPSAGCGRRGSAARTCSPRWRCRPRPGRPVSSVCTRRCSTRPCTRSTWAAARPRPGR